MKTGGAGLTGAAFFCMILIMKCFHGLAGLISNSARAGTEMVRVMAGLAVLFPQVWLFAEDDYAIQKEDVLTITIYDEPDLTTKARVNSSGEISFPLIGSIKVAGYTVNQLKEDIEKKLQDGYLVNPNVNIFVEEYHKKKVYIMGAVNKPGAYDVPRDKKTSIMEVISMAEGFTSSAAINGTKIMRKVDGQDTVIQVKISDIMKKGRKEDDIEVLADDVIMVPDSFF